MLAGGVTARSPYPRRSQATLERRHVRLPSLHDVQHRSAASRAPREQTSDQQRPHVQVLAMLDGVEPKLQPSANPVGKRGKGLDGRREPRDHAKRPFDVPLREGSHGGRPAVAAARDREAHRASRVRVRRTDQQAAEGSPRSAVAKAQEQQRGYFRRGSCETRPVPPKAPVANARSSLTSAGVVTSSRSSSSPKARRTSS